MEISTVHDSRPIRGIGRVKTTLRLLKHAASGTRGSLALHVGSNSLSSTHQSLRERLRLELMCVAEESQLGTELSLGVGVGEVGEGSRQLSPPMDTVFSRE